MRLDDTTNQALQTALKKAEAGLYSDLKITCCNKQYQVHKAIICPRSCFFRNACENYFQVSPDGFAFESRSNVINLPEDDPEAVDSMIYYIYNGYYPKMDPGTQGISKDRLAAAGWKLETFGKMFPCQLFASLADILCSGEFTGGLQVKFLVLHAEVYALAEKYDVLGLKEMAQRCFRIISNCGGCCSKEFAQACEFVYTTTIDSDRGLRDVVVQSLLEHPRALDEEHIRSAMRLLPDLPYDLVLYGRGKEMRKEKDRSSRPSWMNRPEAS
ncbi:Nitrogen assimilation transcription factor nit-4 [Fusarium oxysporum f. sp. albedinis]|nr:Nitrogen assimilation transcription factor nit-4 [Fusarium oxysporum f. sp. albedinis]